MTVTISGTSGITTPGLTDTGNATIGGTLGVTGNATAPNLQGPIFSAYNNASQSASSGNNQLVLNTVEFDTASKFNATGSTVGGIPAYAFLPNVAGYYIFTGECRPSATTSLTGSYIEIWKNGASAVRIGFEAAFASTSYNTQGSSSPIYMNGSTDYVQLYAYIAGTGTLSFSYAGIPFASRFSGYMVRSA